MEARKLCEDIALGKVVALLVTWLPTSFTLLKPREVIEIRSE